MLPESSWQPSGWKPNTLASGAQYTDVRLHKVAVFFMFLVRTFALFFLDVLNNSEIVSRYSVVLGKILFIQLDSKIWWNST
jgi:hypothetical protein